MCSREPAIVVGAMIGYIVLAAEIWFLVDCWMYPPVRATPVAMTMHHVASTIYSFTAFIQFVCCAAACSYFFKQQISKVESAGCSVIVGGIGAVAIGLMMLVVGSVLNGLK